MLKFRSSSPFEELVARATDEKNVSEDWALIIDICDKAVNYEEGPKLCLQAITKRLYHNVPRVVMQALMLLDACVKNCGKRFLLEVSSRNFIGEITKLLPKMNVSTAQKFKQLLKRWAEHDFKDDAELGLIPSLYYKLKSEGVEFPLDIEEPRHTKAFYEDPDAVTSQEEEEAIIKALELSLKESSAVKPSSRESVKQETLGMDLQKSLAVEVRVLYDFEAVEDNELTLKAGERVVVTDKSNENWWRGFSLHGEGYFPSNFVTEKLEEESENVGDQEVETIPKQIDVPQVQEPIKIDEDKIKKALDLLHGTDPMGEGTDSEEMVLLEKDCAAMVPLIENELRQIDKKFNMLKTVNDQLMEALEMFYHLDAAMAVPCYRAPVFEHNYSVVPEKNGDLLKQPIDQSNKKVDSLPSVVQSNYVPAISHFMLRPQVSEPSLGHIMRGNPLYVYYPTTAVLSSSFISRPLQPPPCSSSICSPEQLPALQCTVPVTYERRDDAAHSSVPDIMNQMIRDPNVPLPFIPVSSVHPGVVSSGNVNADETVQLSDMSENSECSVKPESCQLNNNSQNQQSSHQK